MENKLTLFILDDNIPKTPKYVDELVYNRRINSTTLMHLTKEAKWGGEYNLQHMTSDILNSDHYINGLLEVFGFTHPSICLDEIENGLVPDIIIYDWEYGTESNIDRSNWLIEILNSTIAFVFVYSAFRDEIPPFLNKKEFDKDSYRLQLFLKGDIDSSVFSSEEFILQYILSQITKTNHIKIQGVDIMFNENGYLENPSDILFLEKIFGKSRLVENLKTIGKTLSNKSIEEMIMNTNGVLLFDTKRNLLISQSATLLIDKYKPDKELSYLEVLKNYGLLKLIEVLEIGIVKV